MKALDFLKTKGITKATCYTDGGGTYYVDELAKLMEDYAALHQPHVGGSFTAADMEEAYNDGAGINKPRDFDIENCR